MNKCSITKEYALNIIEEKYGILPEYPWISHPNYAVFRHSDNKKWFAVLMQVPADRLRLNIEGNVFIINFKCDPLAIGSFLKEDGVFPSFHMNHQNWVSVLLDGTVDPDLFGTLLDMSFSSTASNRRKRQNKSGICEWIIPANPKYYDIVGAFEQNSEITWKQSSNVRPGDILYMYVAAPYSAIM